MKKVTGNIASLTPGLNLNSRDFLEDTENFAIKNILIRFHEGMVDVANRTKYVSLWED